MNLKLFSIALVCAGAGMMSCTKLSFGDAVYPGAITLIGNIFDATNGGEVTPSSVTATVNAINYAGTINGHIFQIEGLPQGSDVDVQIWADGYVPWQIRYTDGDFNQGEFTRFDYFLTPGEALDNAITAFVVDYFGAGPSEGTLFLRNTNGTNIPAANRTYEGPDFSGDPEVTLNPNDLYTGAYDVYLRDGVDSKGGMLDPEIYLGSVTIYPETTYIAMRALNSGGDYPQITTFALGVQSAPLVSANDVQVNTANGACQNVAISETAGLEIVFSQPVILNYFTWDAAGKDMTAAANGDCNDFVGNPDWTFPAPLAVDVAEMSDATDVMTGSDTLTFTIPGINRNGDTATDCQATIFNVNIAFPHALGTRFSLDELYVPSTQNNVANGNACLDRVDNWDLE